ncbi:MAG: shikimate dehydrogenase [Elusimicrobiota bacterium]|nr:shikimate dehydrogenase [Elusimicrobiota bacterium]
MKKYGPKKTGLVGWPVEHSLSPVIHNAGFRELSLNWRYDLYPVKPENFTVDIEKLKVDLDGFNITYPHKEKILKHLDGIDSVASRIGAVNCAKKENGKWTGTNTDASGFLKALKEDINPREKNFFIAGCGGAAKAAAFALAGENVRKIFLKDIDGEKADRLKKRLNRFAPALPVFISCDFSNLINSDILINATPLGMMDERMPVPAEFLHKSLYVFECIYNRETPLLKAASEKGLRKQNGLNMLVRQAADSFSFWTGEKAPVELMKNVVEGRKI